MKKIKLVIVEDDPQQTEEIIDNLEKEFGDVEFCTFDSEEAFMRAFSKLKSNPPSAFIFDLWLDEFGPDAGIRCIKATLAAPQTSKLPIVIHSSISSGGVTRHLAKMPRNVAIVTKYQQPTALSLTILNMLRHTHPRLVRMASKEIFVVHGHDDEAKETAARFIEKLGGRAVVLHEQPNAGRTIIEKFEQNSNVAFAIVLLTPDDVGGKSAKTLKQRARQNVVFELGFFFAKLGRNRVCALHKENVEIPSDIQGVIYTTMDKAGAWRMALMRELKAAGIPLDYDKAV